MTPTELKKKYEEAYPETDYFSRDMMRFFGDTMRNYGVRTVKKFLRSYDNEVYECWCLYRKMPVNGGYCSSTYFRKSDLRIIFGEEV